MRILLVLAALLLIGMVGLVVHHESTKPNSRLPPGAPGPKIATISHGEVVDFGAHLAEGQWTVFEFGAEW